MNIATLTLNTKKPLIYVLFIGGAADKTSFLWRDIDLPFVDNWPHKTMYHLANSFNDHLSQRLKQIKPFNPNISSKYYHFDYLGYDEICFPEIKDYDPKQLTKLDITSPKFKQLCQNFDDNSHIYIVGHSLGAWNGAHLSRLLANYGHSIELLITLDPVGVGNHEFSWASPIIKQAQIYKHPPIPITKQWINIRGFEVNISEKQYSKAIEDWIAWAGGQWIINSDDFKDTLMANELTDISHKQAKQLFHYCTKLGVSAAKAMEQSIVDILNTTLF